MSAGGISLDAGALIAIERGDREIFALLRRARQHGDAVHVVPEVVAQVWRGGQRQARLAKFLRAAGTEFPAMTLPMAKVVGQVCARSGHSDVVDVHVVVEARMSGHDVVTSDPDDLRRVDPTLRIIEI